MGNKIAKIHHPMLDPMQSHTAGICSNKQPKQHLIVTKDTDRIIRKIEYQVKKSERSARNR